tara:strand:+ start:3258 stop:4295 length:1038 start_codon:yes stop_codon:yes gene_type:complete
MIPNHIKIGNSATYLNKYIIDHNYSKICILVDDNTVNNCLNIIKNDLKFSYEVFQIQSGEEKKNLETCSEIWNHLTENTYDRRSLIINLGGGVICDMGGFIASTYKRGIDFINIPTTLLAQVDASVGGKLGIDFNNFKNQIGVFKIPNLIIVDIKFLATLPERELKSGFAEVIKHCLIIDNEKFNEINKIEWSQNNWDEIVRHSIEIKSNVVKNDLEENGIRKILNFGHSLGHAIETTYLHKNNKLLHGEAIAIGMICESFISVLNKKLSKNELYKISEYILSIYQPIKINFIEEILININQDKKNIHQKIMVSTLNKIGECDYDIKVKPEEIIKSINYYNNIVT